MTRHAGLLGGWLLAAAMLLAGGCALFVRESPPRDPEPIDFSLITPALGIYAGLDDWIPRASDPESAAEWLRGLRARNGVSFVAVQTRSMDGAVVFDNPFAPTLSEEAAAAWTNLLAARAGTGVSVLAAHPVFVGAPRPGEEMLSVRGYEAPSPADRRNPAVDAVRRIEAELVADLAPRCGDGILLTHAGFPGPSFDFSAHARNEMTARIGRTIANWPAEVLVAGGEGEEASAARGPLWGEWTLWRANLLTEFLVAAQEAAARSAKAADAPRPPVLVLAHGYYPLHFYEGLNWASSLVRPQRGWSDAPPGYQETGAGLLLDGLMLMYSAPLSTIQEAVREDLPWWASVEGAAFLASQVAPPSTMRWGAIPLTPYLDEDGELGEEARERLFRATAAAARTSAGVLLLDYRLAEDHEAWDAVRSGLLEARTPR